MERDIIRKSKVWSPEKIEEIQDKAQLGRYRIRGQATKRQDLPSFDDLVFTPAGLSRVPLEGYRERCETKVVIGEGRVKRPLVLETPIMIAGMSYGAINSNSKKALGMAATRCGISTCTGDGGMHPVEREFSEKLVYQLLPSRYGLNPYDLKKADAVEIVISQGAKPGTGGTLLGQKVSEEVAEMRDLPIGVDQRSPCRHPDWMGPDDLGVKIQQIREATNYEVPIFIKIGAGRVYDDVKLAAKVGAEAVVIDGMEGGTAASPEIQLDHTGIPTIAAVVEATEALYEIGMKEEVKLIIGGGISNGADAAKAIALGADVVYMGSAMLIALNCQSAQYVEDYHALGTEPSACHHCHTGKCPVGIATQDPALMARLNPEEAADRVENYINSITMEMQIFARSCGKSKVSDLDPTDLRSLTLVSSSITGVPLVGLGGRKPYYANFEHSHGLETMLQKK